MYVIIETSDKCEPYAYIGGDTYEDAEKLVKKIKSKWTEWEWYHCELSISELKHNSNFTRGL